MSVPLSVSTCLISLRLSISLYMSYLFLPVYLSTSCSSRETQVSFLSLSVSVSFSVYLSLSSVSLCLPLNVIRTFLSLYLNCLSLSGIVSPSFSINGISLSPSYLPHLHTLLLPIRLKLEEKHHLTRLHPGYSPQICLLHEY